MDKIYKIALLGQEGIDKYSLSPSIHSHFFRETNIDGEYTTIAVPPERLCHALNYLGDSGYRGLNLTMPHKTEAIKYVTSVDRTAETIGAINTILFGENGDITGFNTDSFGFLENLNEAIPNWHDSHRTVVVYGAGGAAQAVVYSLKYQGIEDIAICNRNDERAKILAQKFKCEHCSWKNRNDILRTKDMVINATAGGADGNSPLDISLKQLKIGSIIYDIVYKPRDTPLIVEATRTDRNFKIVRGLGMLIYQAAKAFEIWFGVYPKTESRELYQELDVCLT